MQDVLRLCLIDLKTSKIHYRTYQNTEHTSYLYTGIVFFNILREDQYPLGLRHLQNIVIERFNSCDRPVEKRYHAVFFGVRE